MKKAILVISFGTSYHDTCRRTIGAIEEDITRAFSDFTVRRAFTSQLIIDKLKKRDNLHIDNVQEALQRLLHDGYDTVLCQPTHVMNGHEYDKLHRAVTNFNGKFQSLLIGRPLLSQASDYQALAQALLTELPSPKSDEAIVLMGHGTSHFADAAYAALAHHFTMLGKRNLFIGTVEGFPLLADVVEQVEALKPKKVYLAPLMVVAGDHALNDMTGDSDDSWAKIFKAKGYHVFPILAGIGEYSTVRQIYVNHALDALGMKQEQIKT